MSSNPKRLVRISIGVALVVAAWAGASSFAPELILNGDFSGELSPHWDLFASNGSVTRGGDPNDPNLKMTVTTADPANYWRVQAWQNLDVDENIAMHKLRSLTTFTLQFRAMAAPPDLHTMTIELVPLDGAYRVLGLKTRLTLEPSWQWYSINFRTIDFAEVAGGFTKAKLSIGVAQELGTVYVDDISLTETPPNKFMGSDISLFTFERDAETWFSRSMVWQDRPDFFPVDTAHVHEGAYALKLTTDPSGGPYAERHVRLDLSDEYWADHWAMTFWVYVDNPTNLAGVTVALRSGSQKNENDHAARWWMQTGLVQGWNKVVVPKARFWEPNWHQQLAWEDVWDVAIKLETNDNGPASVWIDDLRIVDDATVDWPPSIEMVNLDVLTPTSVTVHWTTDYGANSVLECGLTTSYGMTKVVGGQDTTHTVTLQGPTASLIPNTLYHCQVSSTEFLGLTGRSGDFVFRTDPDPTTPWAPPPGPTGNFQIGLFSVSGFDATGPYDLVGKMRDPLTTRFTHFHGPNMHDRSDVELNQYLNLLGANNRRGLIAIDDEKVENGSQQALDSIESRVDAIKGNQYLAAWYLYDEPEIHHLPVEKLLAARIAVRHKDTAHPLTFAAPEYGPSYEYLGGLDYALIDPYPIPDNEPSFIQGRLNLAQAALKPFDMTVQSYQPDLTDAWPGNRTHPSRFPTRDETRSLAYIALNHGARNVFFFDYVGAHIAPGVGWEWVKTNDVVNELDRLRGIYGSPDPPVFSLFPYDDPYLDVGVRPYLGKAYATVVNRSASPISTTMTTSGWTIGSAKEVITQRIVARTNTTVSDSWTGYGVNVYELTVTLNAPTSTTGNALPGRKNKLSWMNQLAGQVGFEVQRAPKNYSTCGTYQTIASFVETLEPGTPEIYIDAGIAPYPLVSGATYCYQVRATVSTFQSAWSSPAVSITTKP